VAPDHDRLRADGNVGAAEPEAGAEPETKRLGVLDLRSLIAEVDDEDARGAEATGHAFVGDESIR